ncbi:peroxisome assembly protein (Peroxin-2) [Tilletia horrida]|uniref:RING-type E3 ubiquitin transferase (cysteine targeting) n=1 Tax=Tilletia horrida TaxID=155126 RepID=A0AAN6GRL9_9BASI|nr:peroxisome assembly protein (Peroxin-2) [Tilletia horrida]KAK0550261.1 peroxisome assembly protein (Peroxin-2) [Tilletia horrida]
MPDADDQSSNGAVVSAANAEMEPFWASARDASQTSLANIWKQLPHFPSPPLRVQRVNQLDAELLDEELVGLLLDPLKAALANIKATLPGDLEPELLLVLRLVLYKYSIYDKGATYGAMIQNLKYRNEWAHRGGLQSTSRDIPLAPLQLTLYPLLTIMLPWAHTRAERSMTSHSFSDMPVHDLRRIAWTSLDQVQKLWGAAALVNFAIFLGDGKYRTLVDRILGMRLTYARRSINRNVSFEFLNRQLVWHAFTEFLLFLLPLIRPRRILRKLSKLPTHPKLLSFLLRFLPTIFTQRVLGIQPPPKGQTRPVITQNGVMAYISHFTSRGGKSGSNADDLQGLYPDLPKGCCAICWQRMEQAAGITTTRGGSTNSATSASLTGASAAFGALGVPSADPLDPTARYTSGSARIGARRQRPRALQGSQQALANRALKGIKTAARRDGAKRRKARLEELVAKGKIPAGSDGIGARLDTDDDDDSEAEEHGDKAENDDDREEALMLGGVSSNGLRYADAALHVPYAAQPCGCVYCYFCLTEQLLGEEAGEELEDEGGWECLRCAKRVQGAARAVAVEENDEKGPSAQSGSRGDDDGDDDNDDGAGPDGGRGGGGQGGSDSGGGGPSGGPGEGPSGTDDLFDDDEDEVLDFSMIDDAPGTRQQDNDAPGASSEEDDDHTEDEYRPATPTDNIASHDILVNPSNLPPFLRVHRSSSLKYEDLAWQEEAALLQASRTPTSRRLSSGISAVPSPMLQATTRGGERLTISTAGTTPVSSFARSRRVSQVAGATGMGVGNQSGVYQEGGGVSPLGVIHALSSASASVPAGVPPTRVVVPPLNFDLVAPGVYRSGHPNERNFDFLERLGLRSIMYLANEDYRDNVRSWAESIGLQTFHFRVEVNKEPFAEMEAHLVAAALSAVTDKRNLPMLIHCNKGKYRVGCLVGCLRRLQGWSHTSIFEEFARFAGNNKIADQEFIEVFDLSTVTISEEHKPHWIS